MKTWLITGCSSGIGMHIASYALALGHQVIATSRNKDKLDDLVKQYPNQVLALDLEITDEQQIETVVQKSIQHFGTIDVLVNNAGRGYSSTIEEGSTQAIQELFATNLFGPISLIQKVLPIMRKNRQGTIINISSFGTYTCGVGAGHYVACKAGLEKLSVTLRKEVEPFNIKVMVVQPSAFRTNFRVGQVQDEQTQIEDYHFVHEARAKLSNNPFNQKGDPKKAAKVIVEGILLDDYPKMIVLGGNATNIAAETLENDIKEIKKWQVIADDTNFDEE